MTFKKGHRGYWADKHLSEEHKRKISEALKGHPVSEGHRRIISETRKGKPCSVETRRKISEAHKGMHPSTETRQKMSEVKSGENHPMYGKHHSKETRIKMSETKLGENNPMYGRKPWNKNLTKETDSRVKMLSEAISGENNCRYGEKAWNSGKTGVFSEEYRRKLSEAGFGENNSQWGGGKSFEPYGVEFNDELKERIRERDNHQCQLCGVYEEDLTRALDVHHIDYDKENNDPQNLVSLHDSCHAKTNVNRDYWEAYFKGAMKLLPSPT